MSTVSRALLVLPRPPKNELNGLRRYMSWQGFWGCNSSGLEPGLLTVSSTLPTLQPRPAFPLKVPLEILETEEDEGDCLCPTAPSAGGPESARLQAQAIVTGAQLSERVYITKLHYVSFVYYMDME